MSSAVCGGVPISANNIRGVLSVRLDQAWLVARWTTTSPALRVASPSSTNNVISSSSTTAYSNESVRWNQKWSLLLCSLPAWASSCPSSSVKINDSASSGYTASGGKSAIRKIVSPSAGNDGISASAVARSSSET